MTPDATVRDSVFPLYACARAGEFVITVMSVASVTSGKEI